MVVYAAVIWSQLQMICLILHFPYHFKDEDYNEAHLDIFAYLTEFFIIDPVLDRTVDPNFNGTGLFTLMAIYLTWVIVTYIITAYAYFKDLAIQKPLIRLLKTVGQFHHLCVFYPFAIAAFRLITDYFGGKMHAFGQVNNEIVFIFSIIFLVINSFYAVTAAIYGF